MRSILAILLFSLSISLLFAQQPGGIDWENEIDILLRELAERDPHIFDKSKPEVLKSRMNELASWAGDKSSFDVAVKLQQVLALQGDANTMVNFHYLIDKDQILPMECYWFEEGIYFTGIREEYIDLEGKQWTSINNFPLEQVMDSLKTLLAEHHESHLKEAIPRMLVWTPLLQHFGFAFSENNTIEVIDSEGNILSRELTLPSRKSDWIRIGPDPRPLAWKDTKEYFWSEYLQDEKLYYIQFNKCWSRETEKEYGTGASALFMPSMKEFEKQVSLDLKKKDVGKVVMDFRHNSGGHPEQGQYLIRKLARSRVSTTESLYVIIGRLTSNTALIHVLDLMDNFNVVLVGENSGGSIDHYGDVGRFVLPESHLVISHSTRYFELGKGGGPLSPHVNTPLSFSKFMKGIDPSMEYILEQ